MNEIRLGLENKIKVRKKLFKNRQGVVVMAEWLGSLGYIPNIIIGVLITVYIAWSFEDIKGWWNDE